MLTGGLDAVVAAEPEVTRFDEIVGDGDCGIGLKRGAEAVLKELSSGDLPTDAVAFVNRIVPVVEENMDGTSGAIYAIFLNALAAGVRAQDSGKGQEEMDAKLWAKALESAIKDLKKYTPAAVGDRTLMDALVPFVETLGSSGDVRKAAGEAKRGAEETKGMKASLGRAVYVGSEGEWIGECSCGRWYGEGAFVLTRFGRQNSGSGCLGLAGVFEWVGGGGVGIETLDKGNVERRTVWLLPVRGCVTRSSRECRYCNHVDEKERIFCAKKRSAHQALEWCPAVYLLNATRVRMLPYAINSASLTAACAGLDVRFVDVRSKNVEVKASIARQVAFVSPFAPRGPASSDRRAGVLHYSNEELYHSRACSARRNREPAPAPFRSAFIPYLSMTIAQLSNTRMTLSPRKNILLMKRSLLTPFLPSLPVFSVHISLTFSSTMLQCRSNAFTRASSFRLLRQFMRTCV